VKEQNGEKRKKNLPGALAAWVVTMQSSHGCGGKVPVVGAVVVMVVGQV
jgi:hypothetical protein